MRVAHVLTRFLARGLESNVVHWARWQRSNGFEVEFIVGRDAIGIEEFPSTIVNSLVRAPHPTQDLRTFRTLRSILELGKYDVVHTHHGKSGFLGRIAAPRRAVRVHTFHGISFGPAYGLLSPIYLTAERATAPRTDAFVAVGEELRQRHLDAGIGTSDRFHVVHSPIDFDRYAAIRILSTDARTRQRLALNFEASQNVLLSIGALEETKRPLRLVEWLAPLLRERSDISLVFLGSGPLSPDILRRAQDLGVAAGVRLEGWRPDIDRYLACASAVVSATVTEGLPQIVVQAALAGVPVISTDVCGLREVHRTGVHVVPTTGQGFGHTVSRVLEGSSGAAAPLEDLRRWHPANVEREIGQFHEALFSRTRI